MCMLLTYIKIVPNFQNLLTLDFALSGHGSHADRTGSADGGEKRSGEHFR